MRFKTYSLIESERENTKHCILKWSKIYRKFCRIFRNSKYRASNKLYTHTYTYYIKRERNRKLIAQR